MILRVNILVLAIFITLTGCSGVAFVGITAAGVKRAIEEANDPQNIASKQIRNLYSNPETIDIEVMYPFDDVVALAEAAGKGDLEEIQRWLDAGVNIDFKGKFDATPLYWAYREDNLKGFRYLLEKGANPIDFINGKTAMAIAAEDERERYLDSIYELSRRYQPS